MGKYADLSSLSSGWPACCDAVCDEPFDDRIEQFLRPLWGMRLRVSLFAIRINALRLDEAFTLIHLAFSHIGATGALRNGDGGLLYIGPRPPGPGSDRRLEQRVADVMGWTVFYLTEHCTIADIDVVTVHRWLDELQHPDELVRELCSNPTICLPGTVQQFVDSV